MCALLGSSHVKLLYSEQCSLGCHRLKDSWVIITPASQLGVYWFESVRLSLFVRTSMSHPFWMSALWRPQFSVKSLIISMVWCGGHSGLWHWPKCSWTFSYDIKIKVLKYVTICLLGSTARRALDRFVPYMAQMITTIKRRVASSGHWPWVMSSM